MLISDINPDDESCLCPQCLKKSNLVEPLKYEDDDDMNLFAECPVHGIFFICPECLEDSVPDRCKSHTIDLMKLFRPKNSDDDPEDYTSTNLPENYISYPGTFFPRSPNEEWIGALGTCSMCKKVAYGYISNE